jgi:3-hydroxyisobutyrate dehydrogenase-like beta-hydroxyacid dehydrogenase
MSIFGERIMDVGFVGLGNMGAAIAHRIVAAGQRVTVWNRTAGRARDLVEHGAVLAKSVDETLTGDIVFSMLADDQAVDDALLHARHFDQAREGIIHVNLSTISVDLAKKLHAFHRERGQKYVSAPVLGRPDVAKAGQLIIVAAGDADALEIAQPLFHTFGKKTWIVGDAAEKANVVKLANNFMLAAAIESMSEAAALANAYGLTAAQLLDITNTGAFACAAYQGYGMAIAVEKYEPAGFSVRLGAKDVRLALAAAEAVHVPLPVGSAVRDSLLQAKAMGDEAKDLAVLGRTARARAGLDKSPGS